MRGDLETDRLASISRSQTIELVQLDCGNWLRSGRLEQKLLEWRHRQHCDVVSLLVNVSSIDTLAQELANIQQTSSKKVALLGSRHVPIMHQHLIEMMSYALVLSGNRIITSGSFGTNSAVIKGALRADQDLLTVILPQSLSRQPRESREQLENVMHLVENSQNDDLPLGEASSLCNHEIISRCQQLVCFAFHDSHTLLQTCHEAEEQRKLVTLFYFD